MKMICLFECLLRENDELCKWHGSSFGCALDTASSVHFLPTLCPVMVYHFNFICDPNLTPKRLKKT